jgi:hypothetical protein
MAFLIDKIPDGTIDRIDSSDICGVMTRKRDNLGNEYIYLKGVASTALGSWVTFDELGVTALLAANAIGQVAIAQAATIASTYGWYLIAGSCQAKVAASFADNGNLYATATAGTADDAVVAGDRIKCATGRSAIDATVTGCALVQVNYPFMDDALAA